MPPTVNLRHASSGEVRAVSLEDALAITRSQPTTWLIETPEEAAVATRTAQVTSDYDTATDKALGAGAAILRGASVGLSDPVLRVFGADPEEMKLQREAIGGWAAPLEIAGAVAPAILTGGATAPASVAGRVIAATPAARVARLGSFLSRAAPEASAATRIGRGALGATAEGVLQEGGSIASDLALASSPEEMDRIVGSIGSRVLMTGVVSGVGGAALSGLEHALVSQRRRLTAAQAAAEAGPSAGAIPDDLATLDRKGLDVANEAELARIEAERVPQRAQLGDEIAAFRDRLKTEKPWEAVATGSRAELETARDAARAAAREETVAAEKAARLAARADANAQAPGGTAKARAKLAQKAADALAEAQRTEARRIAAESAAETADTAFKEKFPRWFREPGKVSLKSDRSLDNILNDPKALSGAAGESAFRSSATAAQKALRIQEESLQNILDHSDDLKKMYATDTTTTRQNALASIPQALADNRAFQRRIDALLAAPASPRLKAIKDANLAFDPKMTMKQKIGAGLAFGAVMGAASGVDLPGMGYIAPVVAAGAGAAVANKLGGAIRQATAASRARQLKAIDALMTGTRTARKATPVLASKVLAAVRFATEDEPRRGDPPKKKAVTLADHFEARSAEMARLVAPGPNGKPTIVRHARDRIADVLRPFAMVVPHVADKIETGAVRRLEFLADKMPRSTQIGMTRIPPSEMAVRAWARYNAAAEDPIGVVERVADGTVTHEDREVMQALYPDLMAEIVQRVVERIGTLRAKLPHQKRLSLSIFTGAPVDAAMEPRILAQLQGGYTTEPDTEGGTQAPVPRPAFGSVKRPEGTPAQQRAG